MANLIKKIFGVNEPNQVAKTKGLEKLRSFGEDNFEVVPQSDIHPEHLIAHGIVTRNEKTLFAVRTAISKSGNDAAFTTNVGQTQNSAFGREIQECLNRRLEDGKLLAYHNQQEPDKLDMVYASKKPYEWLNRTRTNQEVEHHAEVKQLVSPILDSSLKVGELKKDLDYPKLQDSARTFVNNNLKIQLELSDKLPPSKYLPNPQYKKTK